MEGVLHIKIISIINFKNNIIYFVMWLVFGD